MHELAYAQAAFRPDHAGPEAGSRERTVRSGNLDLSNYLPYLINRVGVALVERFAQDGLRGTRLTIGTWRVLAATANHDGIRQIDLARLTSIEVSTVSRLVTRLVRLGLVGRSRSAKSNREVTVRLRPKGRALFRKLAPVAAALQSAATRGITTKELAITRQILSRMHENLQNL
jgi:DNA-binding MarR family transcriptional regulator